MEMKKYIELGEKRAGKQIELAKILGVRDSTIRLVKTGHSRLPDALCIKLADFIEVDRLEVIAASNLMTEKNEERRKIFESCFKSTSKAASFIVTALFIALISITTPNPANASQARESIAEQFVLCKIEYVINYFRRKFYKLLSRFKLPSKYLPNYSHFVEYP